MITFGSEGKLISTGENTDFDHLRFFTTIDLNIRTYPVAFFRI